MLLAALLWATAAGAEPAPSAPVSVTAALPTAEGVVLIGSSGQIYEPSGPLAWKRRGAGGVAVDVLGALHAGDTLYAAGERTPLFARQGEAWFASPLPNGGPVAVSTGAPAVAVGRHLYTPEGGQWRRLISARSPIVALWAGPRTSYVATERGDLARADGRRWRTLRSPLPAEDPIAWFCGAAGAELYAGSRAGVVLRVEARRATALPVPDDLAGLSIHSTGAVGEEVYLAGTVGDGPERRGVLVRATGKGLERVDDLWALAEGDRYAAIFGAAGAVAVASASGTVRARGADGTWQDGAIDGALPPPPAAAGAQAAPARSR